MDTDQTWPYEDAAQPEAAGSDPSWKCPAGFCTCHLDTEEAEQHTFSFVLADENGRHMDGARCRVLVSGAVVNEAPHADVTGRLTVTVHGKLPKQVLVEWAPENTPLDPRYPFRRLYYVDLQGLDEEEAGGRRLHNLGFTHGSALEDRVRDFQTAYGLHVTGRLADITGELAKYHDAAWDKPARPRRRPPITLVSVNTDASDEASEPPGGSEGPGESNGKVVPLQEGDKYIHPDKVLALWACGIGVPLRMEDNDARLPEPGAGDRTFGQDRWQVGLNFSNFADLGKQLAGDFSLPSFVCGNAVMGCGPLKPGQIRKLAIHAHGSPGAVDVDNFTQANGNDWNHADSEHLLNRVTLRSGKYDVQLAQILQVLEERANVYLMCCLSAAVLNNNQAGEELLVLLSEKWKKKRVSVHGFTTALLCGSEQNKKGKAGASCYPGCRETHFSTNWVAGTPARDFSGVWNDLKALPWGNWNTLHCTTAVNGKIVKRGEPGNAWGQGP